MYFLAVFLHELAHYVVAKRRFYHCHKINISAFGAVLYGEFDRVSPADRIAIAFAGPLANVVLCAICLAMWWVLPSAYVFTKNFFDANLSMAVFNLLPCYPLDGGRILSGALQTKLSEGKSLCITKYLACAVSIVLFGYFLRQLCHGEVLFSVATFAVCLFVGVFTKSGGEIYKRCGFAQKLGARFKNGMEKKTLVFSQNSKFSAVVGAMHGNYLYDLQSVDESFNTVAYFSVKDVDLLVMGFSPDGTLKDAVRYLAKHS